MLTSKERAKLRAISNSKETEVLIGSNGITENLLSQIDMNLNAHELVKIGVLANCDLDCKKVINELALVLNAEPVICVGKKMVLYRYSRKVKKHIEF